jgi:NAD(P)H-hydrate repair Nnr-like enzyme with NAD(P)H-hydrate dehydratase domain
VKYLDKNVVLTPHPKEFISLLKLTNIANISIEELQENSTVAKSLPLFLKYSAKCLFYNRLSQTDKNLK